MLAPQDSSSMGSPRLFLYRMVRAARLDGHIFTSLRDDESATGQSLLVLALAGLSFGFGLAALVGGDLIGVLVGSVAGMAVGVLVGFVWLSLTYLVATRLFKGTSSYWGLARPLFFATSPALFFLLMSIPAWPIHDLARSLGVGWTAVSSVFAVKNAMGFDAQRSLVTFIIVALAMLIIYGFLPPL
ncbi:MAG: hypothetical protein AUG17_02950 [Crenarchaeota archaeon 13_1_20CM_2_53_14]|nr:MAG: hypothetical protein AUG17_02950 [Crenarchaeota archaeon 13_1_20CM_2_53_14]